MALWYFNVGGGIYFPSVGTQFNPLFLMPSAIISLRDSCHFHSTQKMINKSKSLAPKYHIFLPMRFWAENICAEFALVHSTFSRFCLPGSCLLCLLESYLKVKCNGEFPGLPLLIYHPLPPQVPITFQFPPSLWDFG